MSFTLDIEAFEKEALALAAKNTSNIVEDTFTTAVVKTPTPDNAPFSKGLLVNQWYPNIGDDYSSEASESKNENGVDSLSRIKSSITPVIFLGQDNIVTLTNNMEHAFRAEYLGWPQGPGTNGWHWSGRSGPYGMVRATINEIKAKYG